jgi:hypothetical protein
MSSIRATFEYLNRIAFRDYRRRRYGRDFHNVRANLKEDGCPRPILPQMPLSSGRTRRNRPCSTRDQVAFVARLGQLSSLPAPAASC